MRLAVLLVFCVLVALSQSEVFRYIQCFGISRNSTDENATCNLNLANFCVTYPKKNSPAVCNSQITFNDNGIPSYLKRCKAEGCKKVQEWGKENLVGSFCCCQSIDCEAHPNDKQLDDLEFEEISVNGTESALNGTEV
ncbi:hypothetical protein L596_016167 [Steinernema carpocapsae]|uniref:Activin types I and II receptor domain-containing protein n=1 Tax=Steinernema carpocapsae TaxID=34508 RepID=A0A4U5NIA1_STECR|nr:hypothetical protein L596_016167 [Steinernema carpocapsae]